MKILVAIPARLESKRLPRKLLKDLCGKPLIRRTVERVVEVWGKPVVITDSREIASTVEDIAQVILTPSDLPSGTDRIFYGLKDKKDWDAVINVQGDEPFIDRVHIEVVADSLKSGEDFVTVAVPFKKPEEVEKPENVKVVLDKNGYALYFSRSKIPFPRSAQGLTFLKHVGIYGFSRKGIKMFVEWERGTLEQAEGLEQLRILENGFKIKVRIVERDVVGIDTEEDLKKARKLLCGEG